MFCIAINNKQLYLNNHIVIIVLYLIIRNYYYSILIIIQIKNLFEMYYLYIY